MEQLIVGSLLFVPLLALLPTVYVWHAYVAALQVRAGGVGWAAAG